MTDHSLILEITDHNWQPLARTASIVLDSTGITEVLGDPEGEATLSVPLADHIVQYIPDPDATVTVDRRWKLFDAEGNLKFAGMIDRVSKNDENVIISGKQRGVELAKKIIGRRDFLGWTFQELAREFTRDNIGRAPFATVSATEEKAPAPSINVITGEPKQGAYWSINYDGSRPVTFADAEKVTIDLGAIKTIDAVRVIAEWWLGNWYNWKLNTSTDGVTYTQQHLENDNEPAGKKGVLVELGGIEARYVQVEVYASRDGYPRLAQVMVYQDIVDIGSDTSYAVPWIENDDSGNVTTHETTRVIQNGAWIGDGSTNSFVTRLTDPNGYAIHRFRGTATSVYFTNEGAAEADIFLDDVYKETVTIPPGSYQFKGYEVTGLASGSHTLKVSQRLGAPQIDYFTGQYETAFRILEEDSDTIAYSGDWQRFFSSSYYQNGVMYSELSGSAMIFPFTGDLVRAYGTKAASRGKFDWYIDDVHQATVDMYNATNQFRQEMLVWSGTHAAHELKIVKRSDTHGSATNDIVDLDRIEGNFAHIIYLRSDQASNLSMLQRLAEATNSFLRLNYDGTIDFLGSVGDDTGQIIREGENEGGTITDLSIEGDYSEQVSAIVALGKGTDNNALRVFVRDQNAVDAIGVQVGKLESRDATDAYMLVREAWSTLQEEKLPKRQYRVSYVDELVVFDGNDLHVVEEPQVGDLVRLYKPSLNLNGDSYRIYRKEIAYTDAGREISLDVANRRDSLSRLINRASRDLSLTTNTPQGHLNVAQYGGNSENFVAETGGSEFRSAEMDFYIDENAAIIGAKLHVKIGKYRTYERDTTSGGGSTSGSGGGQTSSSTSTPSGGGSTSGTGDHRHVIGGHLGGAGAHTNRNWQGNGLQFNLPTSVVPGDSRWWTYMENESGTEHSHTTPNHTHPAHSHTVDNHNHSTPNHTHTQTYDIFEEGSYPGAVSIVLDNVNIDSLVNGPWTASASSNTFDADLGDALNTPGWHTLRFEAASGKGRITPYVIVKSLQLQ